MPKSRLTHRPLLRLTQAARSNLIVNEISPTSFGSWGLFAFENASGLYPVS